VVATGALAVTMGYAPEAIAKVLPMFTRFSARIIAEVHLPVEETEKAPAALRVLALVRRALIAPSGSSPA
jgi:hypothetical protein